MKAVLFFLIIYSLNAFSSPTKVGNGDDGADLEDLQLVTSGVLISTRDRALKIVGDLNLKNIRGLGYLSDELAHAKIYLARNQIKSPKKFDVGSETSEDGKQVYARTLARPYSAVRFFPSSMMLTEEQLVRLHIHEALHRALPESVRGNESVVSEITLAITSPQANKDAIEEVVEKNMEPVAKPTSLTGGTSRISTKSLESLSPFTRMMEKSKFQFSYGSIDDDQGGRFRGLYKLEGDFYLFGEPEDSLGVSLGATAFESRLMTDFGAINIGFQEVLTTWLGCQFSFAGVYSYYPNQNYRIQEDLRLRNSTNLKISARREVETYFFDTAFRFILPSKKQISESAGQPSSQEYSAMRIFELSAGERWNHLYSSLKINFISSAGNTYKYHLNSQGYAEIQPDQQAFHLTTVQPEIGYMNHRFLLAAFASLILDGSREYTLNDLADPGNFGLGNQMIGVTAAYHF